MKVQKLWAGAATVLFVASLFPMALLNSSQNFNSGESLSGFECLVLSLRSLVILNFNGFGAYMSGFGVTNLLFPVLVGMLFLSSSRLPRVRLYYSLAAAIYALSWLIFMLQGEHFEIRKVPVGVGYYLWLGAYVFLFIAHAVRRRPGGSTVRPLE